jgi:hypothetical protein
MAAATPPDGARSHGEPAGAGRPHVALIASRADMPSTLLALRLLLLPH